MIALEQLLGHLTGLLSHGHRLHRQNIGRTPVRCYVLKEVSNAVAVAGALAWKVETAKRSLSTGIKDPQGIALATDREISVGRPWGEQRFLQTSIHPLLQNRFSLLLQHRVVLITRLLLGFAQLPLTGKQGVAIKKAEHLLDVDVCICDDN